MYLFVETEELSMAEALRILLPKLGVAPGAFQISHFNGKDDMLRKLPARLAGMSNWFGPELRLLIIIDRDSQNCHDLKQQLMQMLGASGITTQHAPSKNAPRQALARIAVEELEAWFIGDGDALRAAYSHLGKFESQVRYRDPDAVQGGTWEALERLLQRAGHYRAGMPKIEVARTVSQFMEPYRNRSRSFRNLVLAVNELAQSDSS